MSDDWMPAVQDMSACDLFGHEYEQHPEAPAVRICTACGDEYEDD